jgi:Fe-S cluster assembly ATP-binding protein
MSDKLEIRGLRVNVEDKEILKGVDLTINNGEIHTVMGPNGSGKSTLAYSLMGHPKYEVTGGEIIYKGENVLEMEPEERSHLGMFLAFQYPFEIEGVPLTRFLMTAYRAHNAPPEADKNDPKKRVKIGEFRKIMMENLELLKMDESEVLQMLVLKPTLAILDETDSGLDIDSVKVVAEAVNTMRGPNFAALVVTHYQRILNHLEPDFVHVMVDGRVVESGDRQLAHKLEDEGYDWIVERERGKQGVAA